MKPTMPTFDDPSVVLTGEQMHLINLDIERGARPEEAIAKHVAVPNYLLPGHKPVYWRWVADGEPVIRECLVGFVPIAD